MTQKRRILSFLLALALVLSLLPATALAAEGTPAMVSITGQAAGATAMAEDAYTVKVYSPVTTPPVIQKDGGEAVSADLSKSGDYTVWTFSADAGLYTYSVEGYGTGKLRVSGDSTVYLRQVRYTFQSGGSSFKMKVVNTEDASLEYTSETATGLSAMLLVPAYGYGLRYRFVFEPEDETYVGFSGNLWVLQGTTVFDGFKTGGYNLSDGRGYYMSFGGTATIRVPHGAKLEVQELCKFYRQNLEYDVGQPVVSGDLDVYTVTIPRKPGGFLFYSVSQEGCMKNSQHLNIGDDVTVALQPLPQESVGGRESSILMNGSPARFLNLAPGESFGLWTSRVWQAIYTGTSNEYVEPDKHYTVLGDPVITVDDCGIIHAKEGVSGLAILVITYDAMEAWNTVYDAIRDDCVGVYAIQVGGTSDGITTEELDNISDLHTFYFAKTLTVDGEDGPRSVNGYYPYTFHPQSTAGAVTVQTANVYGYANPTMSSWQTLTPNEDGGYTVQLRAGRNVIRVSDGKAVRCYVLQGVASDVTVTNNTAPGEAIRAGDSFTVAYSDVMTPQPKLGAIYNPGFGGTVYLEGQLKTALDTETGTSRTFQGTGVQYTIGENSSIVMVPDQAGPAMISGVRIHSGAYGSAPSTHLALSPQSEGSIYGGGDAPQSDGYFCWFEDIPLTVSDSDFAGDAAAIEEQIGAIGEVTYDAESLDRIMSARAAYAGAAQNARDMVSEETVQTLADAEDTYLRLMDEALTPQMKPNADGAYEIDTADELFWFARYANGALTNGDGQRHLSTDAVLTGDITLGESVLTDSGELNPAGRLRPWTPIGGTWTGSGTRKTNYSYLGTFDGQGHTISGLYIDTLSDANQYVGLFGDVRNTEKEGIIRNLTVEDAFVLGANYTGAIAGYCTGTIKNVSVSGRVDSIGNCAGGLAGYFNSGTVRNCTMNGRVGSEDATTAGGLTGGGSIVTIDRCAFFGTVTAKRGANGLSATSPDTITSSYAIATVTAPTAMAFGYRASNCYFMGSARTGGTQFNGKNYYQADSIHELTTVNENLVEKDAEAFTSGEVAYLLGDDFGQRIGEDERPVFNDEAMTLTVFKLPDGRFVNASAEAVEMLIDAIGKVGIEDGDGESCFYYTDRAMVGYNSLPASAKTQVKNAGLLTAANKAYDMTVKDLIAEIDALSPVTENSDDAIAAARAHYDAYLAHSGDGARITNAKQLSTAETNLPLAKIRAEEQRVKASIKTQQVDDKDFFVLENKDQLLWYFKYVGGQLTGEDFKKEAAVEDANALLGKDIVVNKNLLETILNEDGTVNKEAAANVTPWVKYGNYFRGTFDGQGHTISGVYLNKDNYTTYMFGGNILDGGAIRNLRIVDSCTTDNGAFLCAVINGTVDHVGFEGVHQKGWGGGLVGRVNSGAVTNCYFIGDLTITDNNRKVGLIAEEVNKDGTVSNCYVSGTIKAPATCTVGAIAGAGTVTGKITDCWYPAGMKAVDPYADEKPAVTGGGEFTPEDLTSGKLCHALGDAFGQKLTEPKDAHPMFNDGSNTVYEKDGAYSNATADVFKALVAAIGDVGLDSSDADCFAAVDAAKDCYDKLAPEVQKTVADDYAALQTKDSSYTSAARQIESAISALNGQLTKDNIEQYEELARAGGKMDKYLSHGGDTGRIDSYDTYLKLTEAYPALRHQIDMDAAGAAISYDADSRTFAISTEEQFVWFVEFVNGKQTHEQAGNELKAHTDVNAKLGADLTWNEGVVDAIMSEDGIPDTSVLAGYPQLETIENYAGTFDGQGHKLSGMVTGGGLFKTLTGTVKNLKIEDTFVDGGSKCGSIANNADGGTICDCAFIKGVVDGHQFVGGILGYCMAGGAQVLRCTVDGIVRTGADYNPYSGGIVGGSLKTEKLVIDSCHSAGVMDARSRSHYGKIAKSVGGILGAPYSGSATVVTNCWSTMTFIDIETAGGISGDSILSRYGSGHNYFNNGGQFGGVAGYNTSSDTKGIAETRSLTQFKNGTVLGELYGAYVQRVGTDDFPILRDEVEGIDAMTEQIGKAEQVEQQITALLEQIGEPDESDRQAIETAQKALTALGEDEWLVRAEFRNKLRDAAQALEDIKVAAAVEAQIDAIGSPVTAASEDAVTAARKAYDALTDAQKERVGNLETLTAAEAVLAELELAEKAIPVEELIDDIGAVSLDSEAAVTAARAAYDALDPEVKPYVSNYATLQKAERTLKTLQDDAAGAPTEALIDAIGDPVTLADAEAIEAARQSYDALTGDQQALVDNYDKLTRAEAALEKLQADTAAAQPVIDAIDEIGSVTLNSGDAIEAARKAYDALTGDQQALVTNLPVLTRAEQTYAALAEAQQKAEADEAAAQAVDAQIAALGEITADSGAAITAARNAYNALTPAQKALVRNVTVLQMAERLFDALTKERSDLAAAQAVDEAIDAIGKVTLDSGDTIKAVRTAYNALTLVQKDLVENLSKLEAAEKAYNALVQAQQEQAADEAAAKAVTEKIGAIGEVTLNSGNAIEAARNAYEALTDAQKALVENLSKLEAAEKAYDALVQAQQEQAADEAAAKVVTEKIDAIGEVTLNSGAAIEAARNAYEALTDAQKALVENLSKLEAAEAAYDALVQAQQEQAADEAAAKAVTEKIDAIGEVTLNSGNAIEAARKAYEALTDAQKALVENLPVLEAAEKAYAALQTEENPFADVESGSYYYDAVLWAAQQGIAKGITDTTFCPQRDCTRGQIVTFLWRAFGQPAAKQDAPFTDVKIGDYCYEAVQWAVEQGITTGVTPTSFQPQAVCTRAQAVTFLWRAKGKPEAAAKPAFTDLQPDAYYLDAVAWAVANDVTTGVTDTTFCPERVCTRGQIATFLHRALTDKEDRK